MVRCSLLVDMSVQLMVLPTDCSVRVPMAFAGPVRAVVDLFSAMPTATLAPVSTAVLKKVSFAHTTLQSNKGLYRQAEHIRNVSRIDGGSQSRVLAREEPDTVSVTCVTAELGEAVCVMAQPQYHLLLRTVGVAPMEDGT